MSRRPIVLVIRDGWGSNPHPEHDAFNAIRLARTPVADRLEREWPTMCLRTSGEDVGLLAGIMGNSEVGHQNLGAGRIVEQMLLRITRAVRDGSFFANDALAAAFDHAAATGGRVHLLGLASEGRVHSDLEHLFALVELAQRRDWPGERLLVHAITDGRDTNTRDGLGYVRRIESALDGGRRGRVATVIGRWYAMDRDHRWDRVARAYEALTGATVDHPGLDELPPVRTAASAEAAIRSYYDDPTDANREGDEFIVPTVVDGTPRVGAGDAVVFFNFRGDRPREITRAFVLDDAAWAEVPRGGFERGAPIPDLHFATMAEYETGLPVDGIAFPRPPKMASILGAVVSRAGCTQFRCAETEKYAHVTFFFNDYREEPFDGERRRLVPSPTDVTTYDQRPEMSAHAVCDAVLERLGADDGEDLVVVNFANPDMVGHTGRLDAVVRAVETTDACTGRIVDAVLERGGGVVVTADHGNAEQMWDPEHDCPHTSHTAYDVPLHVVGAAWRGGRLRDEGRLADVAPTLLAMMDLPVPPEMTGRCLLAGAAAGAGTRA